MNPIPIYRPLIGEEEVDAAASALRHGWLGMGRQVEEFELAVQKAVDADDRRALAVSTGYAALHLGLALAGVGPGD